MLTDETPVAVSPGEEGDIEQTGFFTLSRSLGLLAVLFGLLVGARTLVDNSFLTHLATGRLILDSGRVPSVDPYSQTAAGQPWTVQSWLISVLYAGLDRVLGPVAIRVTHGLVGAGLASLIWRLVEPARATVVRLGLALIPIVLGIGFWSPRPLMFGLLAMAVLLAVIQGVIDIDARPWLLIPLMWLWANSHGSYPLAIVVLLAVIAGTAIDERRLASRDVRLTGYAAAGIVLAAIGPLGLRVLWFPFQLLSRRDALDGVLEWQAPTFTKPTELLFLALVPLVVLAATRGTPWRSLLPALVFLASGMLATRNIAVGSMVIVTLLAPSFSGLLKMSDGGNVSVISRTVGRAVVAGMIVTVAALVVTPAMDLSRYPVEEVDFLAERGLTPADGVVVTHREAVGNYLTYRYGSDAMVFIDDRFDFYPIELTTDHLTLLDGEDARAILDRWEADVVLWQADEQLADWLDEADEWRFASADDEWVIACRIGGSVTDRCFD